MAPTSLSTMSMSIDPKEISESFLGPLGRRPGEDGDFQFSSSVSGSYVNTDPAADLPGVQSDGCQTRKESTARQGEDQKLLSYEEILRRKNEGETLIIVDGNVYNVTEFLETHPGGVELILQHLKSEGVKDAGPLMRGTVYEDGHSHSKAAFRMLEQFLVGSVKADFSALPSEAREVKKYRYTVDMTKPIVAQVGYLGPDYDQWVHDPIISKESPRFFESDFHEIFTRTKWWVIPLAWVPVALMMFYVALVIEKVPLHLFPGHCAVGVMIWTFVEYILHRFLFHMKTSGYWTNTFHYVLHGFHHKHPMDGARLVFPPAFTLVICIAIWFISGNWIEPYPKKLLLYGGGLLGYVVYDLTHYFLHFGTAFNNETRKMKRYHLNHHFKDHKSGYGITTTLWDTLLRTLPDDKMSID